MRLYTIGFTKKSAQRFFEVLAASEVERLVDVRLHPEGQLAGFAKREDLAYFLSHLVGCEYLHLPLLAPTPEILSDYRRDHDWARYEGRFEALMDERGVPGSLDRQLFEEKTCCLLCSEASPENCHRRLIAERLARTWQNVEVAHLT